MQLETSVTRSDRKNIAFDLDGTLVFSTPSSRGSSVEIPGRSKSTFMSREVADRLVDLCQIANVYLATARHAVSVKGLVEQFEGAPFAGFVLECGWVACHELSLASKDAQCRSEIQVLAEALPHFQIVPDYQQLLCCIGRDDANLSLEAQESQRQTVLAALLEIGWQSKWDVHQERHKTFLYPRVAQSDVAPSKWTGLQSLGVQSLHIAAGDDQDYDRALLEAAKWPMTLPTADSSILELVDHRRGFIATAKGHEGASQLLQTVQARLGN